MRTLTEERTEGGVCALALRRAHKHNALSGQMIAELSDAASRLADDSDVRVIVLGGEGKSFCAGADLDWMRRQIAASEAERRDAAAGLARMLQLWHRMPKPVIGRIHGNVFGGGVGLTAVCDAAIAETSAVFALSETRLGLVPATISPYVAAKTGAARARQLFMSGRRFGTRTAAEIGLISQAVEISSLDEAVRREAESYLSSAPGAVADAKALTYELGPAIDDDLIAWTVEQLLRRWSQAEAQEGVAAFFDRRKPSWVKSSGEANRPPGAGD